MASPHSDAVSHALEIPLLLGSPETLKVQEELIAYVDSQLDKNFDRVERGLIPLMEGQREAGKTLITLASGALVLSLTFIQAKQPGVEFRWLLFGAWGSFILTVLSGTIRHNWTGHVQGVRLQFESVRNQILFDVRKAPLGPETLQALNEITSRRLELPLKEFQKALRGHDILTYIMFGTFLVGLISLTVFAGQNL